ncbi:hypothetical protein RR46_05415 [Papilio xuthus]|uniref:Uncharacterized protein n=1 Tax=Papilio xuthus TaxID=66420 RepID=A0A194Q102_PAPXU|nr:hypothetical protein RR46_05415 [Papilio xuthus]
MLIADESESVPVVPSRCETEGFSGSSAAQIQPPWSCCGVNGYPNNCSAKMTYTKNCQETITIWLQKYQASIYASVAVLHVILASCSLLRRAYSTPRKRSARVSPDPDGGTDDMVMIVLGKGRMGWQKPN